MSAQPQTVPADIPLRPGTDEQFKIAREFFAAAGFTREAVRQRVAADLPEPRHAQGAEWGRNPATTADLLAWIFVLGQSAPREQVRHFVLPYIVDALESIGLLAHDANGYFSPVFVVPVAGLYFAADRWFNPDGSNIEMREDVVYPASSPNTLRFLNLLSKFHCERLLDIGCGSGVLALTGEAQYARRVWATDITERSCAFAEFNRRLNGIANAQVLQGDLYQPVANQAFDRIVAHPPYVPVRKSAWTFSDGGEDGERLTRKIVEGLPLHLSQGGLFLCDATGSDREQPFEHRVREWLGERQAEFDVAVIVRKVHEPIQFAARHAERNPTMGTAAEWVEYFASQKIRRILQMTLCIQRAANLRPVFTTRRTFGEKELPGAIDWLLRIETHAANAGGTEWVAGERPVVPPWLVLQISSRPGEEGFTPFESKVITEFPFASQGQIEPWMAWLLNLCDGRHTTAEMFEMVTRNGYIPADAAPDKFAGLIIELAKSAIVELPSFPLPRE